MNQLLQNVFLRLKVFSKTVGLLPYKDIMPEFGAWIGGTALELINIITENLNATAGQTKQKVVQEVPFNR